MPLSVPAQDVSGENIVRPTWGVLDPIVASQKPLQRGYHRQGSNWPISFRSVVAMHWNGSKVMWNESPVQTRQNRQDFSAWKEVKQVDWLKGVRWRETVNPLLMAERQMALLDASFWSSPAASLWLPSLFARQAAAEAGTLGPTTTAERLRLLDGDLNEWIPTRGDHEGLLLLRSLQRSWERYRMGRIDTEMAQETLSISGREIVDLEEIQNLSQISVPIDREYDASELLSLLQDMGSLTYNDSPLLSGLILIKATVHSGYGGDGSGRIARLLLPLFMRWRSRKTPAPLYLSHTFANTPHHLLPRGDITRWMIRILDAIKSEAIQCQNEIETTERALELARKKLSHKKSSSSHLRAYEVILAKGLCTSTGLSRALKRGRKTISQRGARMLIEELMRQDLVQEITGRLSYRIYAPTGFVQSRLIQQDGLGIGHRVPSHRALTSPKSPDPNAPSPPLIVDDAEWDKLLEETDVATQRIANLLDGTDRDDE